MSRFSCRGVAASVLVFALLAAAPARASLFGESETEKALEAAIKDVQQLLLMLEKPELPFHHSRARNLVSFIAMETAKPGEVDVPELDGAHGAFWEFTVPMPLGRLTSYLQNPRVPPHAVYPGSVRLGGWHNDAEAATALQGIYQDLPGEEEAISYKGSEYEVTTPDPNSGSYYSYDMNRLLAGYKAQGVPTVISVSRMSEKSTVGKKGVAFGPAGGWHFFYSGLPGNLMTGVSWAEAFMYDSMSVFVLREATPGSTTVSLLKWVNAGWKGMNMVKSKHILQGCKDFAKNLSEVVAAPNLPSPEAIADKAAAIEAMDEAAMRAELAPLVELLRQSVADNDDLQREEFAPLLQGDAYLESFSKQELAAELVKEYMRKAVGKSVLKSP